MKITGNGHVKELLYKVPEWNEETQEEEVYFLYHGEEYFLSQFTRVESDPELLEKEINGIFGTSYFSGIGINLTEEGVKVYYLSW